MKRLKKKSIIIIVCALLLVVGLGITAVFLAKDSSWLNATVVDVAARKQEISGYIIDWDSSAKAHEKTASNGNIQCSIEVNGEKYEYEDFKEGWVQATTTYKNKGDLVFTFYKDWVAEDGSFGADEGSSGTSFINGSGGLLIKNWNNNITIDFNGYKIDRNLGVESVNYGSVIKVDEGKKVYFKNGCITGGANTDDGGGVLIYGQPDVYFVNMTITGNFSGYNGGGIYVGSHSCAYFDNLTIEGNYAEHYGGGVYADYKSSPGSYRICGISNCVIIQNNFGSDYRNNVTLCTSGYDSAQFHSVTPAEGTIINVSFSTKDGKRRYIIDNKFENESYFKYFHADDPECVLKTETVLIGGGTLETTSITYEALALYKK